jgi:lipopolysaccharide transport system ATP-binding protein
MRDVVSVENVSKKFCRSLKHGMLYTSTDVVRDTFGLRSRPDRLREGEFWAVNDVSFSLKQGECLGLLGTNGAGKSTLLKMLNGIIRPDTGSIRMRGRIGALIEVGAGFHPMLTGRENIYVSGAILGMSKREIDRKLESIIDFSDLEPAVLDAPVKSYSSGMYVRLGFAVAIHCEPEVLLVDEVLAVGDGRFKVRCSRWISEYVSNGGTLILVSHHLPHIRECCTKVMVMEKGGCRFQGDTLAGLSIYQRMLAETPPHSRQERGGVSYDAPLHIAGCRVLGATSGGTYTELVHGGALRVAVEIDVHQAVRGAHLHLTFVDHAGHTIGGWTSRLAAPEGITLPAGEHCLEVDMGTVPFVPGSYSISAFMSDARHMADFHELIGSPFVVGPHPFVDDRFGPLMVEGSLHVGH